MNKWLTPHLNGRELNTGNSRNLSVGLIAILFLATILLDGIVFPGLFGFREGFLTVLFIVIFILWHNHDVQSLLLGTAFSAIAEFYRGLKFGTLILPFFVSVGTLFLLNRFFNIRSRVFMVISGVIIFVVFWETSVLMSKIL